MFKKILYCVIAAAIGSFGGSVIGSLMGVFLGIFLSLFFREIVYSYQTVLMSILFAVILGGLFGFLATLLSKYAFGTDDLPGHGMLSGAILGFFVVMIYGVIIISDPRMFEETFYVIPITYGVGIGLTIGSIDGAVIGIILAVRQFFLSLPSQQAKEQMKATSDFYKKILGT